MSGGRRLRTIALALVCAALVGCGAASTSTNAGVSATPTSALDGHLTVLAAASLTDAFDDAERTLEQHHPGFSATYAFAGSQQLVTNISNGAPADVVATASAATMAKLVSAGLVDPPRTFARNRLEIAVATGNPQHIATLADLARRDLSVVLADPSVPAGDFARRALERAGVVVTPKSLELDVRSALQKVGSGDADAAIVYSTDVAAAGTAVSGVPIPDAQNVVASYPIAVVKATSQPAAAQAFVEAAVSGDIQRALLRRGFLPPV